MVNDYIGLPIDKIKYHQDKIIDDILSRRKFLRLQFKERIIGDRFLEKLDEFYDFTVDALCEHYHKENSFCKIVDPLLFNEISWVHPEPERINLILYQYARKMQIENYVAQGRTKPSLPISSDFFYWQGIYNFTLEAYERPLKARLFIPSDQDFVEVLEDITVISSRTGVKISYYLSHDLQDKYVFTVSKYSVAACPAADNTVIYINKN